MFFLLHLLRVYVCVNLDRWRWFSHNCVTKVSVKHVKPNRLSACFLLTTLYLALSLSRSYNWLDFCFFCFVYWVAVVVAIFTVAFLHTQPKWTLYAVYSGSLYVSQSETTIHWFSIIYFFFDRNKNACTQRIIAIRIM